MKWLGQTKARAGRAPLILLWLLGVPVPILLIMFLFCR
jgi:hypothetical protein